ncbi:MAG: hypothetical protein BV459_08570 [Thermoplasmata archaeon M11B2D]|nr:MAG: hypothetical protein BV459_08570 [Thermoplasmata archaeon M11B2D]
MVKSTKKQRLSDEKKIFSAVHKHYHNNIDQIAKDCGFSRKKTLKLIDKLEKNKMIWGYAAIVDETEKDMCHFFMLIKKTAKPLDKETIEKIDAMQLEDLTVDLQVEIESNCYVHGPYDWLVSFIAPDITEAKKFSDAIKSQFPGCIQHIEIIQTLCFVKRHYIPSPDKIKLSDFM